MGVLQGEGRLADAPQADQGLGDHDWAHKGWTWKGAGCARSPGGWRSWPGSARPPGCRSGARTRRRSPLLRVAGPRHGAGRRVLFIGDRNASAKRPGASCRIPLEPIAKEELRKEEVLINQPEIVSKVTPFQGPSERPFPNPAHSAAEGD